MIEITRKTMIVEELLRKKKRGLLNPHHSLQRLPNQWKPKDKGNLISDILQGLNIDPIKLAEEKIVGGAIIWILDGVQRTSIIENFVDNVFAIPKSVDRYLIEYSVPVVDDAGVLVRDENGKPQNEIKVFDVRGKKFKQLPQEMQDNFLYYNFDTILHHDCSEEAIAYHLKRYNAGKPMNTEQKGFTNIGQRNAEIIRNIATMEFFEDGIGKYSKNEFTNGKVNRVIAESLMTFKFVNKWSKDFGNNCKYIKENASIEDFELLRGLIEEVGNCVDAEVGQMFDSKNSFLWFGVYSRFVKLGLDSKKFNTFMHKLNEGMFPKDDDGAIIKDAPMTGICAKEIDGLTWENLYKNASTKDTNIVKTRIDFLTKLMCDYFCVECPDEDIYDTLDEEFQEFVNNFENENVAIETLMLTTDGHPYLDFSPETLKDMLRWYKNQGNKKMLEDCLSYKSYLDEVGIDKNDKNLPLFVYAIKYIFDNDIDMDIDDWLINFKEVVFKNNYNSEIEFDDNAIIIAKQKEIIQNINIYTKEGETDNEIQ